MTGAWDDDALLAELAVALAPSRGPAAALVEAEAQAAFGALTLEQELATLVFDSLVEPELASTSRAASPPRTVTFESDALCVTMEIAEDGVTGQVVPPALLRVSAETINGRRAEVVSDELGCFALDVPSRELIRLHLTTRSASAVTEWIRLDPHAR